MNRILALPAGYLAAVISRGGLEWLSQWTDIGSRLPLLTSMVAGGIAAFAGGVVLGVFWRLPASLMAAESSLDLRGCNRFMASPTLAILMGTLLGALLFALQYLSSLEGVDPTLNNADAGFFSLQLLAWVGIALETCLASSFGALIVRDRVRLP